MESIVTVFEEFAVLKKTNESCDLHLTKSGWVIYLPFLCTGEGATAQRGGVTWPKHVAGAAITGRRERPLGVEQAARSITHSLCDLGQIT